MHFWIPDRLSTGGFWIRELSSSDQKLGSFFLGRTAVLKNVGAQYIGLKEDESDQRIILMLAGGF